MHVHEVALSDGEGTSDLHVPIGNLGAASLSRSQDEGSAIHVKVRHSGTALSELDLPAVRILKVDIEGHEPEFFRGGREFLRGCPPDVIIFESNDALYEQGEHVPLWERAGVLELRDLDYDIVRVSQRLGALGPKLKSVEFGRDDAGLDFVAVHRPKYGEIARLLAIS